MAKRLPYIVLAGVLALGSFGGCATMKNTPEIFTQECKIPSTGYTARAQSRSKSVAYSRARGMARAYRDAGLTEKELEKVDNNTDKVIDPDEFLKALQNKYDVNVRGFMYINNHQFRIVR